MMGNFVSLAYLVDDGFTDRWRFVKHVPNTVSFGTLRLDVFKVSAYSSFAFLYYSLSELSIWSIPGGTLLMCLSMSFYFWRMVLARSLARLR